MMDLSTASFERIDAEQATINAKEAVRVLSHGGSTADSVIVTAAVCDSPHPLELPYRAIYEKIARNAGFIPLVEVRPDRRGYIHRLILRRGRSALTEATADRYLSLI